MRNLIKCKAWNEEFYIKSKTEEGFYLVKSPEDKVGVFVSTCNVEIL